MEGAHHPIPPGEMRRVIAAEELVVLIVMRNADERRGRPAPAPAMLVPRMADYSGDLIVNLVREQRRGGDRDHEMSEEPVGLQKQIVEQSVAVVGPGHRRHRKMVPAMHPP